MPEYDIVLFGATGFTGGLVADYLSSRANPTTRWALSGRNPGKLEAVRDRLGQPDVHLISADVEDPDSIRRLAESARVVISTVGPYIRYGEPLVAACAEAGTDYVDLTGEPEFVDLMWLRYHERAQRSGARLVHSCGFDSIPYDLGVLYAVNQLPENTPIHVDGFVTAAGTFSGGTYHSAIEAMGRLREGVRTARERRAKEPRPQDRRVKGRPGRPHHSDVAGGWAVPFPTIDPQTVLRSASALPRYGPDFSYSHYLLARRLPVLAGMAAGAGAAIALAQLGPTRNLLLKLKSPGDGPTPEQRARASFRVRLAAEADAERIVVDVTGGDPGYGETAKMLAESALCLAHDELPERAGQVTPAVAMGQPLIERLQKAGIGFETKPTA